MAIRTEFFYNIAPVIISIESPIIKHTNVVTLSAMEEKKVTLGNKQIPKSAYDIKTGKN
jgi:hypothetical protein